MKRCYIAGPMTGYEELNFPAFHAAAARLRAMGIDAVNPAEINPDKGMSWKECMRTDIAALVTCDAIFVLSGYENSKGACLELTIARALGLQVTHENSAAKEGGLVALFSEETRTNSQNSLYHALIGDIAKQAQHLGAKWEPEDWKRLLIDKFARETGRTHGKIIPNLDSTGVVEVGLLSRKFTKKTANEFVEWLYAWSAENGIEFAERIDADTGEVYT